MDSINIDAVKELNEDQRLLLVNQVRKWGGLNTDAILDPNCNLFSVPSIEGCIGYRIEAKCAIVFGDPLCSQADQPKLAQAFKEHCKEKGLNVIYAIVSEHFANSITNKNILIQFGNKLVLNPTDNPLKRTGSKAVLIRKKVKQALNKGVVINEYLSDNPNLEKEIEEVGRSWLTSREGPQVYIAHLDFFNDREGKRWFYAKLDERIVGFLILNKTEAASGWLLNNLIITPDAPSGISELLITSTFKILEAEQSNNVTVGPVTVVEIDNISGLGPFFSWVVKGIFKISTKLFRLDGQRVFWEKFQPINEPSYVVFDKINLRTLKALMRSMNVKI